MKKGSITIIVLFVLTASALIGVLTVRAIQQQLSQTTQLINYYHAYYYARAGLELQLNTIKDQGPGWERTIELASGLVQNNLNCNNTSCGFHSDITARGAHIANQPLTDGNCNTSNAQTLSGGESLTLPLFVDYGTETKTTIKSKGQPRMILHILQGNTIAFGVAPGTGTVNTTNKTLYQLYTGIGPVSNSSLLNDFLYDAPVSTETGVSYEPIMGGTNGLQRYNNYLLIQNPITSGNINQPLSFCIEIRGSEIPTSITSIISQGYYRDMTVSLQADKKLIYPDFLFFNYIDLSE